MRKLSINKFSFFYLLVLLSALLSGNTASAFMAPAHTPPTSQLPVLRVLDGCGAYGHRELWGGCAPGGKPGGAYGWGGYSWGGYGWSAEDEDEEYVPYQGKRKGGKGGPVGHQNEY